MLYEARYPGGIDIKGFQCITKVIQTTGLNSNLGPAVCYTGAWSIYNNRRSYQGYFMISWSTFFRKSIKTKI